MVPVVGCGVAFKFSVFFHLSLNINAFWYPSIVWISLNHKLIIFFSQISLRQCMGNMAEVI